MTRIRVLLAGTWDRGFGRNILLQRILAQAGCDVAICQVDLWGKREDTIVRKRKVAVLFRALVAYPRLVWRFLRAPRADVVIVPYPGHFDLPILAPLCRLRRMPVVFDVFISLFDTIVSDRGLVRPDSPIGALTRAADRLACRLADLTLADTPAHANHFAGLSGVPLARFGVLWVGAKEQLFHPHPELVPDPALVLFYGTFIPLHGLETIVRAAKELEGNGIRVRIIGSGQERSAVDRLVAELRVANLERIDWVPLERLPEEIARAGVCLGIFGTTGKADRVVPHKVYECLAVGRPVVTGDTAAVRSAFDPGEIVTVPVGDAPALAAAVRSLLRDPERRERVAAAGHARFRRDYGEEALARLLRGHLEHLLSSRGAGPAREDAQHVGKTRLDGGP